MGHPGASGPCIWPFLAVPKSPSYVRQYTRMTINQGEMDQAAPPGFWRRLAAVLYDSLLLFSVLVAAAAAVVVPLDMLFDIRISPGNPLYTAYLVMVCFAFFAWFWTHGGQTLGMRAWRIRVLRYDGTPLRLTDTLARFAAALLSWACLGAGFLWILVDPQKLAWHDRLSKTRLVKVTPAKRRK